MVLVLSGQPSTQMKEELKRQPQLLNLEKEGHVSNG
jgi:hypothetical protein